MALIGPIFLSLRQNYLIFQCLYPSIFLYNPDLHLICIKRTPVFVLFDLHEKNGTFLSCPVFGSTHSMLDSGNTANSS